MGLFHQATKPLNSKECSHNIKHNTLSIPTCF